MSDELDELRRLLGASEQVELEEVKHRIEDQELRAQDVASVLTESVYIAAGDGENLVRALEAPVGKCIQRSISHDTQVFADALFPVMGPAIRRSIVETLKTLVESINRTVDQSFSPKGLGWRIEAMRTGVPFAEVVLKHTLVYRVEEVFLIHKETGLLIEHVAHHEVDSQDSDAVSGMLTAIRDFVNDSFARSQDNGQINELGRVDMGEQVLWMVHGPHAILAAVVRGVPPMEYQDYLAQTLEGLHTSHSSALQEFSGDEGTVPGAEAELNDCLWDAYHAGEKKKGGFFTLPIMLILLLVLAGIGWSVWAWYQDKTYREQVLTGLDSQPGIALFELRKTDDRYQVRGLLDPIADNPATLLSNAGIDTSELDWDWRPFQSLDVEIVLRRARQVLAPPAGVNLKFADGVLKASGVATESWQSNSAILARALPGVSVYDLADVSLDPADILRRARDRLNPPAEVALAVSASTLKATGVAEPDWIAELERDWSEINGVKQLNQDELLTWDAHLLQQSTARLAPSESIALNVDQHELTISGTAPLAWKRSIQQRLADLPGLNSVDSTGVKVEEYVEARQLAASVDGRSLSFVENISLYSDSAELLEQLSAWVKRLQQLSEQTGFNYMITVTGYTDKIGSISFNQKLSLERASEVVGFFVQKGLPANRFTALGHVSPLPGIENRRVVFAVTLSKLNGEN